MLLKLLDATRASDAQETQVQVNDEYGGYQLVVNNRDGEVIITDVFGGGSACLNFGELLSEITNEFAIAIGFMEKTFSYLLGNDDYLRVKQEARMRIYGYSQ